MKILVVSDSHGIDINVLEVLNRHKDIDLLIHLGDICGSEDIIRENCNVEMLVVRGNCDYGNNELPLYRVVEAGGHRIFAVHGHEHGVSYGLDRLLNAAELNNCDIALYGHTHYPEVIEVDGVTVMCPGSISLPRQLNRRASYGMITLEKAQKTCKIHYL